MKLFDALKKNLGDVTIVAEDLGVITPDVVEVQPASSSYERLLALHGSQATSDTQDAPTLLAQFLTKQAIARGAFPG